MMSKAHNYILLSCLLIGLALYNLTPALASPPIKFKLGWDDNNPPDRKIESYGIYINEGVPGPPYHYIGDVYLVDDVILDADKYPGEAIVTRGNLVVNIAEYDVSNGNNSIVMPELRDESKFFIYMKAFDEWGNESGYSKNKDKLCVEVSDRTVRECSETRSSASALDDGGGGGGGG